MKFCELQSKEVVNINTGCIIGRVCDILLDDRCLCVLGIIVMNNSLIRYLNFLRDSEIFEIDISRVVSIGEDVILVDIC